MKLKFSFRHSFQLLKTGILLSFIYIIFSGATNLSSAVPITFTTINDGNWTNTTNVWSTNGATPCNCKPGNTITDTIIINHNINMNSNLTISSGGFVSVASTGALANLNSNLTVTTGILESYGLVEAKEIIINSAGSGEFYGPITAESKFMIYGDVVFDAFLSINNGSLEFKAGSYISAGPDWLIDIPNGNIYNEGTLDLSGTCLKINNGSFYNQPGASITGNGYIETQNGNIYNNGIWSTNVDWCASGSGSGLLTLENCNPPVCSSIPLPVKLLYFNGVVHENFISLEWATASELNNDYFTIEHSIDGITLEEIGNVDGAGNSNNIITYKYDDTKIAEGYPYYRLSQTDFDGTTVILKTIFLKPLNSKINKIIISPNPFSNYFTAEFVNDSKEKISIQILNSMGKIIFSDHIISVKGHNNYNFSKPPEFKTGVYLIQFIREDAIIGQEKLICL